MIDVEIRDDFIKLGQALKLANLVGSGAEAKIIINEGLVRVNNETDNRRGRKLYSGDIVYYDGNEIRIIA
jgi:ribosome-associated protein